MRRIAGVLAAAGGAIGAVVVLRRRRGLATPLAPTEDPRADELRRKLAKARDGAADESDFEAAGMGSETIVDDAREMDDLRRRVHEEARAAADEMRRSGGPDAA